MAGPKEIALGIASVLGKPGLPDPMTISFRGQTLDEGTQIVRAIITECEDAGIRVAKVEADVDLHKNLMAEGYEGAVPLLACVDLLGEIRVFAGGHDRHNQ